MRKKIIKSEKLQSILFVFIFIFILIKSTNFFKNSFNLLYTNYELRLQGTAYGFCENPGNNYSENSGAGYIFYIKDKFNLKKIPNILNFNIAPNQRWIFQGLNEKNENRLIVLHNIDKNGEPKFKLNGYKVLHNHKNICLFLEKND